MGVAVLLTVLLILNIIFGVQDLERGKVTKSAAFTWFIVGFVSFGLMHQLRTLL
jgi:uncharacterized membrane protein YadS